MSTNKVVALDAGHGISTFPPSKGVYKDGKGYAEHDFNSKLVVEIDRLLKSNGVETLIYQKPFSEDIGLTQRTNYYNNKEVNLVYSIHANYSSDTNANGRCVFYWHTSKQSKKMADIVVDEIKNSGYSTHGSGYHASKKGSWTNLAICRQTNMTAVLVENGFMSGSKDFDLIFGNKQDQFIKDMAIVHAKSICRYFGVKYGGKDVKPTVTPKPSKPSKKPASKPKQTKSKGDPTTEQIQKQLNKYWSISIAEDGLNGPDTKKALVNAYQQELNSQFNAGLVLDGLPGAKTDSASITIRENNNYGEIAYLTQAMIYLHDIDIVVDGYFGTNSVKATKKFQEKNNLNPDGVPGKVTFKKLIRF